MEEEDVWTEMRRKGDGRDENGERRVEGGRGRSTLKGKANE